MWTYALRLIVVALELWVQRESRREQLNFEADEKELESLRTIGTADATLRADRVRKRLVRGQGIVASTYSLPASDSPSVGGPGNKDQGRNLHPTS